MKAVYILFSGGYDSSYLVNKVLQEIKNNHQEEEVSLNLISAKCSFSGNKSEREHYARNRLVEYWRSKYYANVINYSELKIDTEDFRIKNNGLLQPLFWLPSLLTNIDTTSTFSDIYILFSYIEGDQALFYSSEIENIVRSILKFNTDDYSYGHYEPNVHIMFPLKYTRKPDIITRLIEDDEFVFDNSTSCEGYEDNSWNKYNVCCECVPCKHLKESLLIIENYGTITDKVRQKCREMLEVLNLGKKELNHYDIAKESKHSDIAVDIVDIKECNCKKEEYEVED